MTRHHYRLLIVISLLALGMVVFSLFRQPRRVIPPVSRSPAPTSSPSPSPAVEVSVTGRWEQLAGVDGGDMHFLFCTSNGILFASHEFNGVWRSEDGGGSWEMIEQDDFVDLHFNDMEEFNGMLFAGTNKGLWQSRDEGKSWVKVETGLPQVDEGRYQVVSLAPFKDRLFFTAVLDKPFRNGKPGDSLLLYYSRGETRVFDTPANLEAMVSARYPYIFVSSPYKGLYVYRDGWTKILDRRTTSVFVDEQYNLYVGTIEDYWYIGVKSPDGWSWAHVTLNMDSRDTIFHFILPDPSNKHRLWFGCGSGFANLFYSFASKGQGHAFVGTGCWDGRRLRNISLKSNFAISLAFYGGETVDTGCGKATRYALVTQGGGDSIVKTADGGLTWHDSYEGVYGSTVNAVNLINSGILKGSIVATAVSGIEIAEGYGDSWIDVDFTLGIVGGKLPGYSWCAVSPERKVKGRYSLLISTGYPLPQGVSGGDGVYGVDLSCLKAGGSNCFEKLVSGPHYEMAIINGKLYAGNMDSGVDVLDLETLTTTKIEVGGAGILVRVFDNRLFIGTYEDETYKGDSWRWKGSRGNVYLYNVHEGKLEQVYKGYLISFSANKDEFIGLSRNKLVYKPSILSTETVEATLPPKEYTDMAVDWKHRIVYLSTYGEGVYYTTVDTVKKGSPELTPLNNGLLTLTIRNLAYTDGYLFAGTQGSSVWRIKTTIEYAPALHLYMVAHHDFQDLAGLQRAGNLCPL